MVKPLSDREKKKIAKKANAQSKASSQKTTSGSSSSSSIYNNSARKSARQAETGRTPTTTKSNSSSRGSGFEPDSVARSGKTRSQLLSELDRKYGQDFSKKDIHDGNRDFLDRIDNLTTKTRFNRQVRNNEKEAQYNHNLMALQRRNDLDDLAAAGRKRFANGAFDLTDRTGKTVEELGVRPETRDDVFNQNAYDFMTPEQRSIYEAFIGLGDRRSANRYLASIEEGLQQQAADKLLQTIQPGNIENVQDFADVTRLGVRSGIGRFETGVQQLVNPDAVSKNYTEMAFEEGRKNMSGVTGIVADLSNTVGFMLLPAGGSMVLGLAGGAGLAASKAASNGIKALSAALFGAASGGSTYNDVLREDPTGDKFDAKVYSIINGALEGSLQYLLGGIGKLGAGGLFKATGKSISGAVAKKLSNVAKASANTPAVKGLIKALVGGGKWAAGASDEALEEWLQAVLDPVMRNYVLGENNEVKLFGEDQLYAAFLGALGATVMNAPSNVGSFANAEQILNETVAKQEAKAAARANKNQPTNAEAQAIPEATKEQIEAHMDNPDVKDLVIQINRLEAGIATGKSRHNDSPTGRKAQLAKAKKDLAALIAKLEQAQTPEQVPEQVPVDNAAGIPGPPPAPVSNNTQNQQVTDENIAEVLTEEPASADNRNGIDLVNKGLEMARGERGRGLVQEGMRNGTEGIISPPVDITRPAGERQEPQPRNLSPAETRRQNMQNSRNEAQDIIDDGEANGLIDSEVADSLREALDSQAETALEGLNNRAEQSVPFEIYRRGMDYLERQKQYLSPEEYDSRAQQLEDNFRRDAAEAGFSEEEIDSALLSMRTEMAQVTDADIDEAFSEAGESTPPVENIQGNLNEINAEEEMDNGEQASRNLYANGTAQRSPRDDVGEGVGLLQKMVGQAVGKENRAAETARRREYVATVKGIENVTIPPSLISNNKSGHIKVLPDNFIDEIDKSAPEWQSVIRAYEEAKAKGLESNLVFYSDESYDPNSQESIEKTALGCYYADTDTMWVNVTRSDNPYQTYQHEYYHFLVNKDNHLRHYIRAKLRESGLSNKDLFRIVDQIIRPSWSEEYEKIFGPQDSDALYLLYDAYADEAIAELYSVEDASNSSLLSTIKNKLNIDMNEYIDVVKGAVVDYNNKSGINDMSILSTIVNGYDDGTLGYQNYKRKEIALKGKILDETYDNYVFIQENEEAISDYDEVILYIRDIADAVPESNYVSRFPLDVDKRLNEQWQHIKDDIEAAKMAGEKAEIAPRLREMLHMLAEAEFAAGRSGGVLESRDVSQSVKTAKTNRNSTTKEENLDKLVPENREALEPLKNHRYKPESMDETTAKAWGWIEKHGGTNDDITEPYTSLMNKKGEWKPTEMEAALVMFGSLAQNGDENSASALAAKIIGQAPDFGRVINYFKILQRYMPNAVSAISRSIADQIDVELTDEEKANIDLCDRIAKQGFISDSVKTAATPEFREWLEEASEYVDRGQLDATTAAYAAAMSLVTAKQPSTARQKFRAFQRISLLSNPKTHFRNILGNVAEQAGSIMSRPGADLTDRFISKFTNQRTFGSGGAEAFAKAVTDSVEKAVMDHALGINTVGNKFDEDTINRSGLQQLARQNAFDEKTHKALRNGISRVANNIDHLIGLGLSIGDAPFLIGTYEAALTQIMNANNATEATEEMMDTAWDVAFRRTFRDNNAVTKALTGIRNSLPFIGETIAPYVQTPVNVVLTAIQYSPIGLGEAFFKAFVDLGGSTSLRTQLKNNESTMKTQRQIAELVGRGALGTAAMLVGALLASAGRITGDDDDIDSQKEKNWNTATGRKGSSIKVGDTYIDPSSLQSLSTPIMAGAAAYEGKEEGDGTDWAGILGAAVKASMKMGNTMLEMPVLQGVADLFSGNYDNGELLAGALSLAGNAATQVVPFGSLLKQAGKAVDPYSRVQSEINAGPGERVLKSTVNNLKTMLPGTRKTLSQRYDVLGNPIKNDASDNVAERLYNSFINPFNTSKENTNEVTDEIDRLYAALQDTDVLPSAAGNSISYGGEKYKFTSAEKQEYQRVEGESNAEILSSLVNSEAYDQLTDEEKAKVLSSIYDYSSNKAKADYLKKQGVEYESDAKWMDSIDSIVETGVDIGSAMVYRYELNQIDGADEQAKYIMSLPISADQKKAFDTQFVDKFGFHPITDDRDYTSEDTLALSMTSDSGRGKYDRVFSGDWTAPSGNSYRSLSGVEFGELYDACYFKSSPTKAESIESIRKMLMEKWGLDDYSATALATDFRAVMGSKKY